MYNKEMVTKKSTKQRKNKRVLGGIKFDQDKPRMELISELATEGLAYVLTYGAKKYTTKISGGEDNWRKGMEWRRLIGAALRHLMAFSRGEDIDPESLRPHIDHLACCVMFLSEYQKTGIGTDNRFKQKKRRSK
jgi:hypothetical protein